MGTNGEMTQLNGQLRRPHDDEWLEEILEALRQAAKQAHLDAYLTGTGVVEHRDGAVRVVTPDPAMYEDLIPPPYVEKPLQAAS